MRRDEYDIQKMIFFIREINKVESQSAKFTAYLECKSAIRPILKGQKWLFKKFLIFAKTSNHCDRINWPESFRRILIQKLKVKTKQFFNRLNSPKDRIWTVFSSNTYSRPSTLCLLFPYSLPTLTVHFDWRPFTLTWNSFMRTIHYRTFGPPTFIQQTKIIPYWETWTKRTVRGLNLQLILN